MLGTVLIVILVLRFSEHSHAGHSVATGATPDRWHKSGAPRVAILVLLGRL